LSLKIIELKDQYLNHCRYLQFLSVKISVKDPTLLNVYPQYIADRNPLRNKCILSFKEQNEQTNSPTMQESEAKW